VTVFLGGVNHPRGIITFDWQTMAYTKHSQELLKERRYSTCAKLKGQNGETLIVIAAGEANPSGMEAWNPEDGSVTMLTPDFPKTYSYGTPAMISVNQGSNLIYYEAWDKGKGIYKYSVSSNTWTMIGEMLETRDDFNVLPVSGIKCD